MRYASLRDAESRAKPRLPHWLPADYNPAGTLPHPDIGGGFASQRSPEQQAAVDRRKAEWEKKRAASEKQQSG